MKPTSMDNTSPNEDALNEFINELDSNLKALTDMAQILGQDCKDQYSAIQTDDSQMYRRGYVRSGACVMAVGVQDRLLARFIISDARSVHHNVIISLADAPNEERLREALKKELIAIESR
jgi:hypothetical protein